MNKKTIAALSAAGFVVVGLATPKPTQAFWLFDQFKSSTIQAAGDTKPDFLQSLVEKLATRFNLSQADVQAVFDQVHQEKRAYMNSQFEASLTQAVIDGKLTEEQKQLILQKHRELQAEQPDLTQDHEVLREQMKVKHDELKQWAQDNNIPLEYLRFGHTGKGRGMPKQ